MTATTGPQDGARGWGRGRFATRCVHGAGPPDPATGAVVPPVSLATTFAQDGVGGLRGGFEYSRTGNPTRSALERHLAALEGAAHGLAFASGMAAEDAVLRLLGPGDRVLVPDDAYGGTIRLATRVHAPAGLDVALVDLTDLDAVRAALTPSTRMVWVETPTNPLLRIVDIAAVAGVAHEHGAIVVVDNTFATPALQQPLALGADVVVHSTTKYLGGHSDVVGGFVATDDGALAERLAFLQNAAGAVPGAFDCYLVHRGARTLQLRMARHCESAAAVAELLASHAAVTEVRWPGLASDPGHEVACRQMSGFGGMVSFRLAGGEAAALEVCRRTEVFTLGESLGAVESLIEHPGRMTHASVAGTAAEVPADLVRLSIGIEDVDDLLDDLRQALDGI
jgi:cystathionine gamma-synthase